MTCVPINLRCTLCSLDTFIYGDTVAVVMIFITLHTSSTILLSVFSELYKEVSHCELRLNRIRCKGPDGNHDVMLLGLITCWWLLYAIPGVTVHYCHFGSEMCTGSISVCALTIHFLCDLAFPDCTLNSSWPPLFLHDFRHSSKCRALPASSPSASASNFLPFCSQLTHHISMEAFLQYSTKELSQLSFLPLPCSISFLEFNLQLSCFFIALRVLPSLPWKCKSLLCGAGY